MLWFLHHGQAATGWHVKVIWLSRVFAAAAYSRFNAILDTCLDFETGKVMSGASEVIGVILVTS